MKEEKEGNVMKEVENDRGREVMVRGSQGQEVGDDDEGR